MLREGFTKKSRKKSGVLPNLPRKNPTFPQKRLFDSYADDKHLVALSTITNLPLSEIYEVATFYAHFNIVKNSETYEPIKVVRVCESLTCELFGAHKLLKDLKSSENKNIKVLPGPCMGRCDVAPTVCVGKNYVLSNQITGKDDLKRWNKIANTIEI